MSDSDYIITNHAIARMQQRGILHQHLEMIMQHGTQIRVKGGCVKRFIPRKLGAKLVSDGIMPPQMEFKVCNLDVVLNSDQGVIVTVEQTITRRRDKRSHGF